MATINRFEELECWQMARTLCQMINKYTLYPSFATDFGLKNQINNSSGSVMDNIAEGFERGGRKEFVQFLGFAKGSAGEVRSQLYRALDKSYINENEFKEAYELSNRIGSASKKLMEYLNSTETKGVKYKVAESEPFYFPTLNPEL